MNAWRSALRLGREHQRDEDLALEAHAVVELHLRRRLRPHRRTSAAPGSSSPSRRPCCARTGSSASAFGCSTFRLRTSGSGRSSATRLANASAASTSDRRRPACRTASGPAPCASSSLFTGSPLTIMFSAVSTPSTRGRRCVPPAPGIRPSFTSGSAICVPGARHAVVAARAPARGRRPCRRVWIAATTGLVLASSARITRQQVGLGHRLRRAELADVGAARERLAGAGDRRSP